MRHLPIPFFLYTCKNLFEWQIIDQIGIVFAKRNATPPWIRDTLIEMLMGNNNNYRDIIATEFLQTSYQLKLLREQETMVG